MAVTEELVQRGGDLKGELVAFALSGRFDRDLRLVERQSGRLFEPDGTFDIAALDHFILQHRLRDSRGVVDHFLDAHPELSQEEREMLWSWCRPVEGIFTVEGRRGDAVQLASLVDDLPYLTYSSMGAAVFDPLEAGSFVIGRLVPLEDAWLVSGVLATLPATEQEAAYQMATRIALQHPELVYRNPAKLELGWKLQRENQAAFVTFFGSDMIVVPGRELAERMQAFHHYELYGQQDASGTTAAERAREKYGVEPVVPVLELPDELIQSETVGLIYDEIDGLSFLPDFGRVLEAFERPERSVLRRTRKVLLNSLRDPATSPRLLSRLAARDPGKASRLFQLLLRRPDFSWDHDGDELLREYKGEYFRQPVVPTIVVTSDAVARARVTAAAEGARNTNR